MGRWAIAIVLGLAVALGPARSWGQTAPEGTASDAARAEAAERFERARALYKEGSFGAALVEFRAAYDLFPSYRLLYNIGQVQYQLKNYVGALVAFRRYLKDGGDEITPARRAEVEQEVATLEQRVATVMIFVDAAEAAVAIDDEPVGRSPVRPTLLAEGRHKLSVTKDGYAPFIHYFEVVGGRDVSQPVTLVPLASPAPREANEPPRPREVPPPPRMTRLSWIGVGSAGALAVGATITGVLALGASSDLTDHPHPEGDASADRSRVRGLAVTTDVLIGAAVVTLGVTLLLTFTPRAPRPSALNDGVLRF